MANRVEREKRLELLDAISARLESMGVPGQSASPSGDKIQRTFANVCSKIYDQCSCAEILGIDFRAGFEVNEFVISQSAARLAQQWYESDCNLSKDELKWVERRPSRGNWNPKRWFKKVLLKRERQITDYFFKLLHETGKFETPIICNAVLQSKQRQNHHAVKFAEEHQLICEIDGKAIAIPFLEAASSLQKRSAKLYVRALGLEVFCTKVGLRGFFVTLTLPGNYHPNPSSGKNSWCGATPEEGHDELHRKWRLVQREVNRSFGKLMGIRVEEPHEDGCPHWHLLIYINPQFESQLRKIIERYFGDAIAAKVEAIDPAKGRGASYIMKYILPVLNASDNTVAARYQAHRATWGKRAIQIFDIPGSSTLWDQMRRIKQGSKEYQALSRYAHELHSAACSNDYSEFLCVLSRNAQPQTQPLSDGFVTKNIRRVSILYTERWVDDCSAAKDQTSSKLRKIQGIKDHENPIDTHPHDWKVERKATPKSASLNQKDEAFNDAITTAQGTATVMHSYPSNAGRDGEAADLGARSEKISPFLASGESSPVQVGHGLRAGRFIWATESHPKERRPSDRPLKWRPADSTVEKCLNEQQTAHVAKLGSTRGKQNAAHVHSHQKMVEATKDANAI